MSETDQSPPAGPLRAWAEVDLEALRANARTCRDGIAEARRKAEAEKAAEEQAPAE